MGYYCMKLFMLGFMLLHSLNPLQVGHHFKHKSFKHLPDKWHDRLDTLAPANAEINFEKV